MAQNPFLVHSLTGTAKAGGNTAPKVPCKVSKYHAFHLDNEACPDCEPPAEKRLVRAAGTDVEMAFQAIDLPPATAPMPDWWVHVHTGTIYDLNARGCGQYRYSADYIHLSRVRPGTVEAKRICGCAQLGKKCQQYTDGKHFVYAHDFPALVKATQFWTEVVTS